jgi:penicillin-binding protein 2
MGAYFTPEDKRPPTTPQLSLRVAALGFVALALFAIVFFRLWYLQVLAGDQYLAEANQNRARVIPIPAPRGDIVDRNGKPIVTSRLANVVQLNPRSLAQEERDAAAEWGQQAGELATQWLKTHGARYRQKHPAATPPLPPIPPLPSALERRFTAIGKVLTMRPTTIQQRVIRSLATLPYAAITLRIDVPRSMLDFLEERKKDYPGVVPDTLFLRKYPEGRLAAQLLGNVGEVSPEQLKETRFRGVRQGTIVGKSGIELAYDRYLRGRDGARKLQVNAQGQFTGEIARARRAPVAGSQIKLSLDLGLQKAGQSALRLGIATAQSAGTPSQAGAFVAMNPASGEVYAMGSEPSFDPTEFTRPISNKRYKQLNSEESGAPLFNRALQGMYPTGSTFKPITALAAMRSGKITPSYSYTDNGCIEIGNVPRCNAGHPPAVYGTVDLRNALKVSSDVYFYTLGLKTNSRHTETIQSMAHDLGLGRFTGIDLPGELKGNVPDWKWRLERADEEAKCRRKKHIPLGAEFSVFEAVRRGCGISDMREWSEGDNVNLAVGQGDVQASPLQMAVAYSSIAMDGRVPRPHLGLQVEDSAGARVQEIQPGAARRVDLDDTGREAVLDGIHLAASAPGGTSTTVWDGWDQNSFPVYGKTGTAETFDHGIAYDQSWYVCWIKDTSKPDDPGIVIAVTIEKGGFGATTAAPTARLIASKWFKQKAEFVVGDSHTR